MIRAFRISIVCASVLLAAMLAAGQDLGSSNKLFKGAKKKSSAAKEPAKAKASTSRARAKKNVTAKKATARKTVKPKATDAKTAVSTPPKPAPNAEPPRSISRADRERYEQLIDEGNQARDDRNYTAAENAYRRAKVINPTDSRASYGLGNLFSDQQRWDESEAAYREALRLEPSDALALVALSYVLTQPLSTANLGGRYEEAEKLARKAIALSPRNALAYDQLGVAMELRGLIGPETENAYRQAIRLDPTFGPSYAHLGRLLRRRGKLDQSTQAYADALHHSTDVPTMILVAETMQSEQRYKESEQILQDAVKKDPRNPAGLLLLGRALTTLEEFVEAETVLRRSLSVSPNGFMANSLLGTLYARQGRIELAENALLQAARSVPAYEKRRLSQQFEMVGDEYIKVGKRAEATRAYKQAVSLDTETESLTAKLARARTD